MKPMKSTEMIDRIIATRGQMDTPTFARSLRKLRAQVTRETERTLVNAIGYLKFTYTNDKKNQDDPQEID
jgi:hypothetical protein